MGSLSPRKLLYSLHSTSVSLVLWICGYVSFQYAHDFLLCACCFRQAHIPAMSDDEMKALEAELSQLQHELTENENSCKKLQEGMHIRTVLHTHARTHARTHTHTHTV